MKKNLAQTRKNIDKVDREIVKLIGKRAALAVEAGKSKNFYGAPVYVPSREREVLRNVISANKATVLKDDAVEAIYTEIISACRNAEQPLKIAFLGPWATFAHQAAMKSFGSSGYFLPCVTPLEVLNEIEHGRADFGVIPIENSNEGSVNMTLDMLVDTEVSVCGEISLKVEQCMLVKDPKAKILRIYSHPHGLAQCSVWISKHYPDAELIPLSSTSEAAKTASKEQYAAAIASEAASKIYDLYVLHKGVQDSRQNYTRFFVIGKIAAKPTGKDKTSLAFMIKDRVGALYDILKTFKSNKINLTKIESRPTKKKAWEYVFFVDLEGHIEEAKTAKAVNELKKHCMFVKVLGSYPRA
ncbi:MAG: prephenate dehydratase [Endomicrobia bacterium]|nr:prephenate dehydratase [Endomicrobiia bacterium]